MYSKIFFCFALIGFISTVVFSSNSSNNHQLTIEIKGIKKATGQIMLSLCDSEEQFMGKSHILAKKFIVEQEGSMTITLPVSPGSYALSIYHDINADSKLNMTFLGIPKEPYGFSNDARGIFGPPKFQDAQFSLEEDQQKIVINLN
jgi:uncharacterized protein (DUF2141 family)